MQDELSRELYCWPGHGSVNELSCTAWYALHNRLPMLTTPRYVHARSFYTIIYADYLVYSYMHELMYFICPYRQMDLPSDSTSKTGWWVATKQTKIDTVRMWYNASQQASTKHSPVVSSADTSINRQWAFSQLIRSRKVTIKILIKRQSFFRLQGRKLSRRPKPTSTLHRKKPTTEHTTQSFFLGERRCSWKQLWKAKGRREDRATLAV